MKEEIMARETRPRMGPEPETPDERRSTEWPKEVRTTMEPDRVYRVNEAEYRDLKAQGILKEGN